MGYELPRSTLRTVYHYACGQHKKTQTVDGEQLVDMPPTNKLSVTLTFEPMTFRMPSFYPDLVLSKCDVSLKYAHAFRT